MVLAIAGLVVSGEVAYLHITHDMKDAIWMGRNFYGALKVRAYEKPDSDNYHRRLVHGTILHGEQYQGPGTRDSRRRTTRELRAWVARST